MTKKQHRALQAFRDADFDAIKAAKALGLRQPTSLNQMIRRIGERVVKTIEQARTDFFANLDKLDEEAAHAKRVRIPRND